MSDENVLTDVELSEIEARATKATPGPWAIDRERGTPWNVETAYNGADIALASQLLCDDLKQPARSANAEFIACAREDVPRLIAEVRRLRSAISATIAENLHLADGKVCTLWRLKKVLPARSEEGKVSSE